MNGTDYTDPDGIRFNTIGDAVYMGMKNDVSFIICFEMNHLSQTVAFGDSENDAPMLRVAGVGIAMGNADDSVKRVADMVTASNNDNGIAAALKKIRITAE